MQCRNCDSEIEFKSHPTNPKRVAPFNKDDGQLHFDRCKKILAEKQATVFENEKQASAPVDEMLFRDGPGVLFKNVSEDLFRVLGAHISDEAVTTMILAQAIEKAASNLLTNRATSN